MSTLVVDGKTAAQFIFNHIISRFGVPQAIVTDHGSHFSTLYGGEDDFQVGFASQHLNVVLSLGQWPG